MYGGIYQLGETHKNKEASKTMRVILFLSTRLCLLCPQKNIKKQYKDLEVYIRI